MRVLHAVIGALKDPWIYVPCLCLVAGLITYLVVGWGREVGAWAAAASIISFTGQVLTAVRRWRNDRR